MIAGRPLRVQLLIFLLVLPLVAQTMTGSPARGVPQSGAAANPASSSVVPRLVNFAGTVQDSKGQPVTGEVTLVFSLYNLQEGGSPLWTESQKVQLDDQGHYTVLLGATEPDGLPLDLFTSGEAQWLGIQPQLPGYVEQPRVLLVGMPYALKAADADTVGGLPPSAFVMAAPQATGSASPGTSSSQVSSDTGSLPPAALNGSGTTNYVPLWTASSTLGNSAIYQGGTATNPLVGIGTTVPTLTFQVKGASTPQVRASSTSTSGSSIAYVGADANSAKTVAIVAADGLGTGPMKTASGFFGTFTSQPAGIVTGNVERMRVTTTGQVGIGTTTPAATLEVNGTARFDSTVTFAAGQTFPGVGTVTSIASGAGLTGGPITGSGTLSLASASCPAGSAAVALPLSCSPFATLGSNSFGGNQAVTGNLSATGEVAAGNTPTGNVASGTVEVDAAAANSGGWSPALNFGGGGEVITSTRTASTNQYGLDFFTDYSPRLSITNTGLVGIGVRSPGWMLEVEPPNDSRIFGSALFGANDTGSGVGASYALYAAGGYDDSTVSYNSAGLGGFLVGGYSNVGYGGDGLDSWAGTGALSSGYAGFFDGNVWVDGNLSKSGGSFKIDDPIDPADKYLYHSFVESPDMMNIYNGNVALDANGEAVIELPEWFGTLNRDYRYQLTCIGGFAPVYVAEEIANNHFKIAGGKAGMKVSWTVTGIRQDAWANAHRIPVEVDKPAGERGYYIHPELYGAPAEKSVEWARHPEIMERMKADRARHAAAAQSKKPRG
jgi:trimeric autotransporter adhesin